MFYRIRWTHRVKLKSGGANVKKKDKSIILEPVIPADPFGSYTGVPIKQFEKPVQDADDL